ncbi:MAG: serine protease [Candidatus Electrothrix sp. GM3_4]|nr:serine protease [Candidatus Electrothrix sp. GM3_4]
MAIILKFGRPALLIQRDTFESQEGVFGELLERYRKNLEDIIPAVARVQVLNFPAPYVGTAFLVGKSLAMTTRYVATSFIQETRGQNLKFKKGLHGKELKVKLDFKVELGSEDKIEVAVKGVRFIHPWLDIALLELADDPEGIHPCRLAGEPPKELIKRSIAVVGYPTIDALNDIVDTQRIFKGIYGVKRLMLGLIGPPSVYDQTITHDASTLGGTGGAPVIDLETGKILGIHYSGTSHAINYAVSAWELARDPWVYSHGVERSDNVLPAWHELSASPPLTRLMTQKLNYLLLMKFMSFINF